MEKTLVKTGVYTFIITVMTLVVFMKREISTTDFDGYSSYEVIPYAEYFFTIFRYSIIVSVVATVTTLLYLMANKRKSEGTKSD